MLKLVWTPEPGNGVPADASWQARRDTLAAGTTLGPALQEFPRFQSTLAQPGPTLAAALDTWLAHRSNAAPVTIMAHGFLFDPTPTSPKDSDPFSLIYAIPGVNGALAQLSLAPLVGECDEDGGQRRDVAIAFGWKSQGGFFEYGGASWDNNYKYAALDLAPLAARALAAVIAHLSAKKVKVRILAHSLGTRLVTQAVRLLKQARTTTSLERVVFLSGAEFCVDAADTYAGCTFDVICLGSWIDEVLLFGGTQGCDPVRGNGSTEACVIGRDGLGGNTRWLDLQLSDQRLVNWLMAGHAPTGTAYTVFARAQDAVHPNSNMGHWSHYTNKTNRPFVRDLLLHDKMTVAGLMAAGVPHGAPSSVIYGHFNGVPIPSTPTTAAGRSGQFQIAANPMGATG